MRYPKPPFQVDADHIRTRDRRLTETRKRAGVVFAAADRLRFFGHAADELRSAQLLFARLHIVTELSGRGHGNPVRLAELTGFDFCRCVGRHAPGDHKNALGTDCYSTLTPGQAVEAELPGLESAGVVSVLRVGDDKIVRSADPDWNTFHYADVVRARLEHALTAVDIITHALNAEHAQDYYEAFHTHSRNATV